MIYADYAATSGYISEEVIEAITDRLRHPGNAGRSSHHASLDAARIVYEAREEIASFFDMENSAQVVFTSGITMSLNTVIKGILKKGDHVITTYAEHNSVLRPLYEMETQGVTVSIVAPQKEEIIKKIQPHTKAVIMTCASNVTGDIYDFKTIGNYCRQHHILCIVDTAQYLGEYTLSMKNDGIDIACFTAHKGMMGPQGIGGICIREGIPMKPLLTGGSGVQSYLKTHPSEMPTALEAGTLNIPGIAGLYAALQQRKKNMSHQKKAIKLAETFYKGIKDMPHLTFYGDYRDFKRRTPIVAFNIGAYDSAVVSDELSERFGIETRPGAHCAPLMHTYLKTCAQGIVRFSFGYGNTKEEIAQCIKAIHILACE